MTDGERPAPAEDAWGPPSPPPLQKQDLNVQVSDVDSAEKPGYNAGDAASNLKLVEKTKWNPPMPYNYTSSTAATAEQREEAVRLQNAQYNAPVLLPGETAEGDDFTADVPLWASSAQRYEWNDSYGEVAPQVPELERQLFNDHHLQRAGTLFKSMQIGGEVQVTVESETEILPIANWDDAGLHPVMLENIKLCQYVAPTAIQGYCTPAILQNFDLIAISQTGSGKTAAFFIPILAKLMGKAKRLAAPRPAPGEDAFISGRSYRAEPLVLVVVPTRELAVQIFDEARRLCYRSMLRPCVAYGGGPRREQIGELKKGCDILIGTPGRLCDFMGDGSLLSMSRVRYTVLDEADELVGLDWADELKTILFGADTNQDGDHRYMMFSATFPKEARTLAKALLANDHVRLRVGRIGSVQKHIKQTVIWVEEPQKRKALFDLLISLPPARTIVFVNSKQSADYIDDFLFNSGLPSTSIHSSRTQREREDALRSFRSGKTPILVATGVSARGWDVRNVNHVINFDLPSADHGGIQEYTHRIGRTGRIGHEGQATSFYNDRNIELRPALVKTLLEAGQPLPDFFEEDRPAEGEELDFDDNSEDDEPANANSGNADIWDTPTPPVAVNEDGGW